jgi:hypothetical protein
MLSHHLNFGLQITSPSWRKSNVEIAGHLTSALQEVNLTDTPAVMWLYSTYFDQIF